MAVPASKISELVHELLDQANLVGEFRLHAMRRDITALYAKGDVDEFTYHHVLNAILSRLGDWDRSLGHALKAIALRNDANALNNAAVAYLRVDPPHPEEAARLLVEATGLPDGNALSILANLAEAFAGMGAWTQARETLAEAFAIADLDNVEHLYRLSDASGAIGQYERSVELFARFLARRKGVEAPADPLPFIDGCPDSWWVGLHVPKAIEGAVARVRALREPAAAYVDRVDIDASASALAVLEEMRPYRARANKSALPDG